MEAVIERPRVPQSVCIGMIRGHVPCRNCAACPARSVVSYACNPISVSQPLVQFCLAAGRQGSDVVNRKRRHLRRLRQMAVLATSACPRNDRRPQSAGN